MPLSASGHLDNKVCRNPCKAKTRCTMMQSLHAAQSTHPALPSHGSNHCKQRNGLMGLETMKAGNEPIPQSIGVVQPPVLPKRKPLPF